MFGTLTKMLSEGNTVVPGVKLCLECYHQDWDVSLNPSYALSVELPDGSPGRLQRITQILKALAPM